MKALMTDHVTRQSAVMFKHATTILDKHLTDMRCKVEEEMENKKEGVFEEIRRDYMNVIAGVQVGDGQMSLVERECRADVKGKIQGTSDMFTRLVALGGDYREDGEFKESQQDGTEFSSAQNDEDEIEDIEMATEGATDADAESKDEPEAEQAEAPSVGTIPTSESARQSTSDDQMDLDSA